MNLQNLQERLIFNIYNISTFVEKLKFSEIN